MKYVLMLCGILVFAAYTLNAQMKLIGMKGEVSIRHGVSEQWVAVAQGDVLKPEDSIRLAKKASATILTEKGTKLQIPELTVLDLSDLRVLTQEELLLKLAMERVRIAPDQGRENDFQIPRTSTVHGSNMAGAKATVAAGSSAGLMQLNGVRVLYNNGYYATSVLKAKEIFRLDPQTSGMIDARLMVASALEKLSVRGEALSEYADIARENLTEPQRSLVEGKIADLKKGR